VPAIPRQGGYFEPKAKEEIDKYIRSAADLREGKSLRWKYRKQKKKPQEVAPLRLSKFR
jgi:hypothetical protein